MDSSTSTATDSSAFTLRAWHHGDKGSKRSISKLIERINAQEGSFRNITEEGLEKIIRDVGPDVQPNESTEGKDEAEHDEKSQKEKIVEAKKEIVNLATQAWTESSHTLDLISLVVSQFNSKAAEYTMTPFIKQTLPAGCLGTEVLEVPAEKESTKLANDLTSFGWKLESLSASADSLLRSASNLQMEMEKEAKYWEDVLAVKNKGWSLCTLPRERHALGVRYGFLESGPEFRDRGLAALRRGEDGAVDLDLGAAYLTPRPLRVQVKSHGKIVASTSAPIAATDSLEGSILQARNNLFDEELYHEMNREARALTNRGAKCVGDGIVLPVEDNVGLIVSLFDEEDTNAVVIPSTKSTEYQEIPELAATAFRLLLSHSHRQHYIQRTELPPPLKKRKQQRPLPAIIQPVLSHLEHRSCLKQLSGHLQTLNAVLIKAEVPLIMSPVESSLHLNPLLKSKGAEAVGFANSFVDQLCSTVHSSIRFQFGPEGTKLKIVVRTHANGTEFRAEKTSASTSSALGQTPDEMHFSDLPALEAYLSHLVVLHLVDLAAAQNERWQITDPDEGELTTEPTMDGEVEMLQVRFEHGELELTWRSSHMADAPDGYARWRGADEGNRETKGFAEEVGRLSALRAIAATAGM